ncbi:hypothetical protein DKP76_11680 [Falsochrobactrum shanghaiense]|uniref:DUF551 domain-containing protein n=1 Tax=Falsochrobactrum shanghaiense TaxID=2201899 RepID=A0A316J801_9HYPH|nr:hypothetical protein [Falsochrobactrum shanghaiense]PWL17431.1 hypothetical protein DKP76_11680 [Falsochrobactrum shanghaiense]
MTISEQAVKAALDKWRDHEFDGTLDTPRMRAALTAAAPYMQGAAREQALDLSVLERLAKVADDYDEPDEIGPFPDIQDAMITVRDLRQIRKLLAALSSPDHADAGKVHEYVQGYEFRADNGGGYTPTDGELAMIEDAIQGFISDAGKSVEGDGWLPIETAPTNKAIQIFVPNADYYGNEGVYAGMLVDRGAGQRWTTFGWAVGRDLSPDTQPVRWRPLHSAPASEGAE